MNLLFLTMLFPVLGFIILACSQGKWSKKISAIVGISSIGMSLFFSVYVIFNFLYHIHHYNYDAFVFIQKLWTWFVINDLNIEVSLRLDGLSSVMLLMIVGVGFIIHIYAAWYMYECEGYSRFFAYTNLFMFNMILLVLSDNLLLMYFGWEGVGLCSYLLIGFYYHDVKNSIAAFKAFIMTRFGDICLVCALFIIYAQYHTLSISELFLVQKKYEIYYASSNVMWICCSMLLIGAIVKSAQFPFHTWLISAMVGPTPVSALVHAATMITSGVYLINRMSNFFVMVPSVLYFIGIIGAITMILSSLSALFQYDIKKILAYSTISQIGYMFLSLGGGNWAATIFHLIIHAFFKALLFLAAGSLIYVCSKEQNIFKMGGLFKSVPLIYYCFLIGGASLSAFPIITAGFYSKELILLKTLLNHDYFFWILGLIGVFLTPIYIFRMIFVIFHGIQKKKLSIYRNNFCQTFPLIALLLLSTCIGGWMMFPLLNAVLNLNKIYFYNKIYFEIISGILLIFGIWVASYFWLNIKFYENKITMNFLKKEIITRYIMLICHYGWGFDKIYRMMFLKPYLFIVKKFRYCDPFDVVFDIIVAWFLWLKNILKYSVNGKLNWYISLINIGTVIYLAVMLLQINMYMVFY